ncbi:MAG: HNH endonuclease [Bdellovibrionales bacterium]
MTSDSAMPFPLLLFLILLSFPAMAEEGALLPHKVLTPGEVRSTNVEEICQPGYSKSVRRTSPQLKRSIYKKYGIKEWHKRYKIDHLIPLSIGGSDNAPNLWPSPLFTSPMNGYDKDRLEFKLYRMVCHEDYDVKKAQKAIQENWLEAYKAYCSEPDSCPSFVDYMEERGVKKKE